MAEIIAFPREDRRRHTVLVVDDEPAVRELLSDYLNQSGFNVLAVESGDEAARMLARGIVAIDFVFSDIHMPGILNGHALAEWVLENRPSLPVLLASGDLDTVDSLEESWGASIIAKPYDPELVVRKIRATLERRAKRRA
jgi:DNA-binding NtrC family response regulator